MGTSECSSNSCIRDGTYRSAEMHTECIAEERQERAEIKMGFASIINPLFGLERLAHLQYRQQFDRLHASHSQDGERDKE